MLNNQPMGFYDALTLVKDAQRHGLHFLPVNVEQSEWPCSIEAHDGQCTVRLGFNYIKGFSQDTADRIVAERSRAPFAGIDDLRRRIPQIAKAELKILADLGALNPIGARHRRDALWQSELALRPVGNLLESAAPPETPSPLLPMNPIERLQADFANTGLSIGAHPMRFCREQLDAMRVTPASQAKRLPDGSPVRVAGMVICRQQPQTAKGFVFLSLEDETGIMNVILKPKVFARLRVTVLSYSYLLIEGTLQNQRGVVSVKAKDVRPSPQPANASVPSHDFH
jgi:error-prone DNA polymerase